MNKSLTYTFYVILSGFLAYPVQATNPGITEPEGRGDSLEDTSTKSEQGCEYDVLGLDEYNLVHYAKFPSCLPLLPSSVIKDGAHNGPRHTGGISWKVATNGLLEFSVEAVKGATPKGSIMFDEMMDAVRPHVLAVHGVWWKLTGEANLITFRQYLAKGYSPEFAAAHTFTGKMAIRYGFTQIKVLSWVTDEEDYFVRVIFSLSEQLWLSKQLSPPEICKGNSLHYTALIYKPLVPSCQERPLNHTDQDLGAISGFGHRSLEDTSRARLPRPPF